MNPLNRVFYWEERHKPTTIIEDLSRKNVQVVEEEIRRVLSDEIEKKKDDPDIEDALNQRSWIDPRYSGDKK